MTEVGLKSSGGGTRGKLESRDLVEETDLMSRKLGW